MNKTVNINLGGMFFHIDEDAYQKLTRYFDAIKRSLSNSNGQDEIIKDIEMRIAELITEKHTNDKQVINIREVEEIITVMGQPEDYRIEDDGTPNEAKANFESNRKSKKLYRDTERGMLGGVCTGLSYYLGIDKVWLRIFFVIFVCISFGTGLIAYVVLWAVTPAAVTTLEKIEMTGEPVNISNIERKVREEFDNVSEKFKNANYDQLGNQVKTGAERVASNIGEIFMILFKAFAKVLGALIMVFAAIMLGSLIIGFFTLGSTSFINIPFQNYLDAVNYTNLPMWIIGLLGLLAVGIPFFFLFILGLKLLVTNLKSIGSIAKYTLLAVWLISIGILITLGVKQATEIAFEGKLVQKETIQLQPTDTLTVKFRFNDYYSKDVSDRRDFLFTQDEKGNEVLYCNDVSFHILKTDATLPYFQIEKKAQGKSLGEAKKRAEKIKYGYTIQGNQLLLDNYLLTDVSDKYRNQEVEIFLYLPKGTILKTDESLSRYDQSDSDYFDPNNSGTHTYIVQESKVKCLNCPAEEKDWDEVENSIDQDSTSSGIILNKDGILIKAENNRNHNDGNAKEIKSVKINQDGITIKTK